MTRRVADSQVALLNVIQDYRDRYGHSPTYREMMYAFGVRSTNAIHCRLHWLELKGLVDRGADNCTRQTRLTPEGLTAIGRVERSLPQPFAEEMAIEELGL